MCDRILRWEGCHNARDLGGLPTRDGFVTNRGRFARADTLDHLTAAGWDALRAHGIQTVIDLRNADERAWRGPADLRVVPYDLDGVDDRAFWDVWGKGPQFGSPLYYEPFLERHAARLAWVVNAMAEADGGVLFHCGRGRDRTGLVALALLSLADVEPEAVADDYELSHDGVRRATEARGELDEGPIVATFLQARGTTARALVLSLARATPFESLLVEAGAAPTAIAEVRARLRGQQAS